MRLVSPYCPGASAHAGDAQRTRQEYLGVCASRSARPPPGRRPAPRGRPRGSRVRQLRRRRRGRTPRRRRLDGRRGHAGRGQEPALRRRRRLELQRRGRRARRRGGPRGRRLARPRPPSTSPSRARATPMGGTPRPGSRSSTPLCATRARPPGVAFVNLSEAMTDPSLVAPDGLYASARELGLWADRSLRSRASGGRPPTVVVHESRGGLRRWRRRPPGSSPSADNESPLIEAFRSGGFRTCDLSRVRRAECIS